MSLHTLIVSLVVLLCSCGTGMKVRKENFVPIDNNFSGTFNIKSHYNKGKDRPDSTSILDLFEIYQISDDSVSFQFDSTSRLIIILKDSTSFKTLAYSGKFSKRGYYEIYLRREIKSIPPLFPLIYGHNDIYRLRLGLSQKHELIIDNKWSRSGHILFLAGGGGGRSQYLFRPLKKYSVN